MSSSTTASPVRNISPEDRNISPEEIAAAAERRNRQHSPVMTEAQRMREHEKRQAFRRLIDPGILRPNSKEVAMAALNTLSTISQNLLREPGNPKFQQFKPTNSVIKRTLMDPKGTLEYAIALGFRPEVKDFQPYYVFNARKMEDLRIGSAMLEETLVTEREKEERQKRAKAEEKAAAAAVAQNVKLAFFDDRKTKELQDRRERELRAARAARRASQEAPSEPPSSPPRQQMPGSGHMLVDTAPSPIHDDEDALLSVDSD
ncbi:hypothetical protein PLICRDRAFT_128697 [Plicaturopsis crispa FD-325 SS-3]|nr:hypothetical protein PLICRDRAFT_128697 [Plicaturopsis crispa FD-325 SS-3]